MRILFVVYGSDLGGAERSALDCAAQLTREGTFQVVVACMPATPVWNKAVEDGLDTCPVGFPSLEGVNGLSAVHKGLGTLRTAFLLGQLIRRHRAKLVHANGIKAAVASVVGAGLARVPVVFHVRDYPRRPVLHRFVCSAASATIVPSIFIRNSMPDGCPRVHVVANGVNAPVSLPARGEARRSIGVDFEKVLVTAVAQLVPWKRHDVFLMAAAILARERPNSHFCIVGGDIWGRNKVYVEKLRQLAAAPSLSGKVTFTGYCSNATGIIADSDVLVLPSEREPFGRVVVEAWHCGTPIIAANGSGPEEMIEHGRTGFLFQHGSVEDLVRILNELVEDVSLRRRCAREGRRQCEKYSVERHTKAVAAIYRDILS